MTRWPVMKGAAGDGHAASARERVERVDDALAGDEGLHRVEPLRRRPPQPHRPRLPHRQLVVVDSGDQIGDAQLALSHLGDGPLHAGRHEDAMKERFRLLHGAQFVPTCDAVPRLHGGTERPGACTIERRMLRAAFEEVPFACKRGQRSLHAVEDVAQQPGAEFHLERSARVYDRIPDPQARGLLVDLQHGLVALESDHLGE